MADVMVKGFIIARTLELIKEHLDAESFAALENELGVSLRRLKVTFFNDYPVALQFAVEERASQILWHESYDSAAYRIGRLNFTSFRESTFGRTAMAMVGKDPKKLVRGTVRLIAAVTSGLVIDVTEKGEKEFSVRFRNAPHRPMAWKGTIDAALESTGIAPDVRIVNHGVNNNEFVITWS